MIVHTKRNLKTNFEMTDNGKCAFVLSIELVNNDDGNVTMCKYATLTIFSSVLA